jgi:hypothetical protein
LVDRIIRKTYLPDTINAENGGIMSHVVTINKKEIKSPRDAWIALTATESLKAVSRRLNIDYDVLRLTLLYGGKNKTAISAICKDLGISPEVFK